MKFLILILTIFAIGITQASEAKTNQLQCRDGLYVGTTYVHIDMDKNTFSIDRNTYEGGQIKTNHIVSGSSRFFYSDENLAIIDLYEKSDKTGTLIAFYRSTSWKSRLEYLNTKVAFLGQFSCSLN